MWVKVKSKLFFFICGDYEIRTPPKSCKDFVLPLHYSPLNLNIFGGPSLTVSLLWQGDYVVNQKFCARGRIRTCDGITPSD